MPTYDYGCTQCGSVFEVVHKMSESPAVQCASCHAPAEKKLSLGAGLMFKGSGFYVTDYPKPGASSP
jgi:putative FmdB family regulatory protein